MITLRGCHAQHPIGFPACKARHKLRVINMKDKEIKLDELDVMYIKETLRLLHAAVNRKQGHGTNTYRRFKRSIKLLGK